MIKKWVGYFRQPDSMLLCWLTLQLIVGWVVTPSRGQSGVLWPGTIIVSGSFACLPFMRHYRQRAEPYLRYAYLAGLMLLTMFVWIVSHSAVLVLLHMLSVLVVATLYLEPRLISLVTICYLPSLALLYVQMPPYLRPAICLVPMAVLSLLSICLASRDKISLIRQLELEKSFERLGQQQHLATIGQIAASIAHDIRNPLTSISGFVQLIEKSEHRDNYLQYYQIIRSEIGHIDRLLREVLLLSKSHTIDAEGLQPVRLPALLQRLATLIEPDAIKSNIAIQLDVACEPVVKASEEKLHQVFLNIVRNAFEAVGENGRIYIKVREENGEAIVCISDSGPGIPQDKLNYLFTPFFTTKAEGTGLGLSICQSIVKAYGGTIEARNGEEQGAEFLIALPLLSEQEV